uniref:Chromosome 11 open reading frame 97 n=1 Tax=Catharus ustulatus TaxID=91951 RepID=A0A8C3XYB9_CATUS
MRRPGPAVPRGSSRGGPARRAAWQPRAAPGTTARAGGHEGGGPAGARGGGRGAGQRHPRRAAPPGPPRGVPSGAPPFPAAPRQKSVYVEPPRRVKEILEEHFHFQKEECNVKHPAAVALEEVWNMKNNFSIRRLKPVSQNSSDLLLQPQFYSRHARMKSKSQ